jgi:hypothetical protein
MAAVTVIFSAHNALGIFHQDIAGLPLNQGFFIRPKVVQPHNMADGTVSFGRHFQGRRV